MTMTITTVNLTLPATAATAASHTNLAASAGTTPVAMLTASTSATANLFMTQAARDLSAAHKPTQHMMARRAQKIDQASSIAGFQDYATSKPISYHSCSLSHITDK